MTNNKHVIIRDLITKPMVAVALAIAATVIAATVACGGGETVVQTVVVEKSVPGQTVIQTVIVEKEVAVAGERVVQTVVVEKAVVVERETMVEDALPGEPGQAGAPAAEAPKPIVETVIVEKVVVKEVEVEVEREVVVEKVVEAEAMSAAPSATPVVKTSPPRSPSQPPTRRDDVPKHYSKQLRAHVAGRHLDLQPRHRSNLVPTRPQLDAQWIRSRPGIGPSRRVDQRLQLRLRDAAARRLVQHPD